MKKVLLIFLIFVFLCSSCILSFADSIYTPSSFASSVNSYISSNDFSGSVSFQSYVSFPFVFSSSSETWIESNGYLPVMYRLVDDSTVRVYFKKTVVNLHYLLSDNLLYLAGFSDCHDFTVDSNGELLRGPAYSLWQPANYLAQLFNLNSDYPIFYISSSFNIDKSSVSDLDLDNFSSSSDSAYNNALLGGSDVFVPHGYALQLYDQYDLYKFPDSVSVYSDASDYVFRSSSLDYTDNRRYTYHVSSSFNQSNLDSDYYQSSALQWHASGVLPTTGCSAVAQGRPGMTSSITIFNPYYSDSGKVNEQLHVYIPDGDYILQARLVPLRIGLDGKTYLDDRTSYYWVSPPIDDSDNFTGWYSASTDDFDDVYAGIGNGVTYDPIQPDNDPSNFVYLDDHGNQIIPSDDNRGFSYGGRDITVNSDDLSDVTGTLSNLRQFFVGLPSVISDIWSWLPRELVIFILTGVSMVILLGVIKSIL